MNGRNLVQEVENISFNNLVILNRLGRGSTSHVFKTQSIRTKKYYAMKVVDKSQNEYQCQSLLKQINIHKILKHQHISQFIKHFEDEDNHYILTEYCNSGEITKLLMNNVQQKKLLKIIYQISLALDYMHNQKNIVHGDLKLSNILINGCQLKLCDFGFSFKVNQVEKIRKGPFGTLLYMAPQVLQNCCQDYKKADVWALGICLLTLMVQGNPYKTQSNITLKKKIINAQYMALSKSNFPSYSHDILELVSKMLKPDTNKRIKVQQILKHKALAQLIKIQNIKSKKALSQDIKNKQKQKSCTKQNLPQILNQNQQVPVPHKQQCQTLSQLQQKQDINKSIFNQTADTLSDADDTTMRIQNCKMWSYSIKPQKHETQNNGYIQILKDHSIKIKIDKLEYIIAANGSILQIVQGSKNCRKYVGQQINKSQKICKLFNYAMQLVRVLKKKYCLKQEIVNKKYFWVTKKQACCLINQKTIISKQHQSKNIYYRKIGQQGRILLEQNSMNKQIYKYAQILRRISI